jgi:hypothetical protein
MAPIFTKIHPKTAGHAALFLACAFLSAPFALIAAPAAFAQAGFVRNKPGDLPDSSQFYMSRRQIQYVDDSPIVKFGAGAGGTSAPGGSGPTPAGGQMALPRAGFQSYTSAAPSITTPLPKVNNGVPPKPTPAEEKAMQAKAAALSRAQARAAAASRPKAPPPPEGIKAYNSYKGYNPASSLPGGASGSGASSNGTEGKVKGNVSGTSAGNSRQVKSNVLHWSKKRYSL